ncbi:switch-associated protein 70-like [Gossypium hirsutum]|uniref:Switch-associated protein 70-like n=1 Tax=Gossypium hirsutum TaxID=3635 RepID=A0A1U8K1I0_GOSHI|nr:switch-associated protein 70-like [Gossypium hirsutum]
MLELRKKNAEYETVSTKLIASRSEHRELREKMRELEETLQARQQQLDTLLEALQEKNSQHDRDTRAYGRTLYEKDEKLSYLINEIRKVAVHVVQLSNEVEVLSCQFPSSRRSNISEFLEQVKKYSDIASNFDTTSLKSRHSYRKRRQVRVMEVEFNERIERMKRIQKELQEQLAKSQQEIRDLMVRSREESLEQRDQMARMMEMMSALVKGKGPINPDVVEPQSRVNLDQDPPHPLGFTPPHTHAI